jgi:hypothetical protein
MDQAWWARISNHVEIMRSKHFSGARFVWLYGAGYDVWVCCVCVLRLCVCVW